MVGVKQALTSASPSRRSSASISARRWSAPGTREASGKPPHASVFRLTREGFYWLLGTAFLFLQGWLRNFNLVTLIACMLATLWVLNLLWVAFRFRRNCIRLRRRVEEPVFAGDTAGVVLEVRNESPRSIVGFRIADQGVQHDHAWLVRRLKKNESLTHRYAVALPKRGIYEWPGLTARSGYPFGLFRRTIRSRESQQTIVLPRLGKLNVNRLRRFLLGDWQSAQVHRPAGRRHPTAQHEFHALRNYQSGDSLRSIHWRTSARLGALMVREYEEPPENHLLLILDPCLEGELLELAVSFAATTCWEWRKLPNARLALVVNDHDPAVLTNDSTGGRVLPLLERLALVEGQKDHDCGALVNCLAKTTTPGPALLVSTREGLERTVADALGRPVTRMDVTRSDLSEFFETVA